MSVARNSVPVIGVVAFGWRPLNIAVFFLLESWLFLSSRMTIEVTFDPKYGGAPMPGSRWRALGQTIWMFLLASVCFAVLIFGFGGVIVVTVFSAEEWREFLALGWRRISFLVGLAGLAADVGVDAIDFRRRLVDRTDSERRADDLRVRVMFYRVGALMMAFLAIGLASSVGLGGPALIVAISAILVYVEVFPRRAVKIFG